ncbi:hypothetical protein ACO0QE_002828 [Hanseniaspora vineae]
MENSAFVKTLASNNRSTRQSALESLNKYLQKKDLKQQDYDKLWKGLYYSMWFSDRPRPQQRLANELGELFVNDVFVKNNAVTNAKSKLPQNQENFIKFAKSFWKVILLEWMKIDHHRLDKYLLLIRRVFYNQILYLHVQKYDQLLVQNYMTRVMERFPLSGDVRVYNGIPLHIIDIFVTEWERVFKTDMDESSEDEDDAEIDAEVVRSSCVPQFIEVFAKLTQNVDVSKVLKTKIKEDILQDSTLSQWGVLPENKKSAEKDAKEEDGGEEEEEEEEWNGF